MNSTSGAKYSRASEAARAELFAAESAREAVRLSLIAQVAQQYFALLASDAQVEVTQRLLTTRNRISGAVHAPLSGRNALGVLAASGGPRSRRPSRAQVAALRQAQERNESALAVLLGRSPRQVIEDGVRRGNPPPLQELVVPRRPDRPTCCCVARTCAKPNSS